VAARSRTAGRRSLVLLVQGIVFGLHNAPRNIKGRRQERWRRRPGRGNRARKGDIGVYITGLGSVTPIYTVTLKSRVDGQLMNIRYKEGDVVRQNDLWWRSTSGLTRFSWSRPKATRARPGQSRKRPRGSRPLSEAPGAECHPEQQLATQKAMVAQGEGIVQTDQGQIDAAKLKPGLLQDHRAHRR